MFPPIQFACSYLYCLKLFICCISCILYLFLLFLVRYHICIRFTDLLTEIDMFYVRHWNCSYFEVSFYTPLPECLDAYRKLSCGLFLEWSGGCLDRSDTGCGLNTILE